MSFKSVFRIHRATVEGTAPMRHRVYCEELGYEPTTCDRCETDQYDADAMHCMVTTPDDEPIGCVRVIVPVKGKLPFQQYCDVDLQQFSSTKVGEVSRLMILKDRRSIKQPGFPHILPALYMSVLVMAHEAGIDTLFIECEQRLVRHLNHVGVDVDRIGQYHEHNGQRAAHKFETAAAAHELSAGFPQLWEYVSDSMGA